MYKKTVATPVGQPSKDVEFTAAQVAAREAEEQAWRDKVRSSDILSKRRQEYGSVEEQLDMIATQGVNAFKAHRAAVDAANPLPQENT